MAPPVPLGLLTAKPMQKAGGLQGMGCMNVAGGERIDVVDADGILGQAMPVRSSANAEVLDRLGEAVQVPGAVDVEDVREQAFGDDEGQNDVGAARRWRMSAAAASACPQIPAGLPYHGLESVFLRVYARRVCFLASPSREDGYKAH